MVNAGEVSRGNIKNYSRGESYIFGEDMTNNYGSKNMRKLVDFEKDFNRERKKSVDVKEQIVEAIGGFGPWQRNKCLFIIATIWMGASFHLLKMVFYRAETDFLCADPPPAYLGEAEWKSDLIRAFGNSSCLTWEGYNTQEELARSISGNKTRPCRTFQYDTSFWQRTIVQEWDLVCSREHMQKWTQQVTFFGLLVGVILSGVISDRIGRVKAMMILLTMIVACGVATAFSKSYYLFLLGTWGTGFASIGFGTVMYCWMMELLSGKWKAFFGCLPHLNFAFWGLSVALVAYLVPDWHKMELIFSIPLVGLYCTYRILPESPRWLLTHGRTEEAEKILHEIADYNGKPIPKGFKLIAHEHEEHHKGVFGVLELFKTPNLRRKTLIVYYLWFATSVVYYGLTLNSNAKGSIFTYYCLGKAMEFPAISLAIFCLIKAGRRITLMLLFGTCGLSLVLTYFVPEDMEWVGILLNVLGRGSSNGCLCLCYVYSAEVYPTVIRNAGIGSSSFWARIGPMLAPYIADLRVIDPKLPLVTFGFMALLACFLVAFLPETAHHKLPDTILEGEEMGKGDTLFNTFKNNEK